MCASNLIVGDFLHKHPPPWRWEPIYIRPGGGGPTGAYDGFRILDGNGQSVDLNDDESPDREPSGIAYLLCEAVNAYAEPRIKDLPAPPDDHLDSKE
jgi:hypothetical protein